MKFQKPLKVLTTAALLGTLSLGTLDVHAFAKETEKSVVKSDATLKINQFILEKDSELVTVPYLTYVTSVNGPDSLNGYKLKYLQANNEKVYKSYDYALYYSSNDTISKVLDKLEKANKSTDVTVSDALVGKFVGGKLVTGEENVLTTPTPINEVGDTTVLTDAGTYGGTLQDPQVINGDVVIKSDRVNLSNVVIKGNLTVDSTVGAGDIIIDNTKVEGNTYLNGGGINSVHLNDTVVAKVIVNKNDGKIRVVVSGDSFVKEVRLESYAKLEEDNLDVDAEGFTDVSLDPTVQRETNGLEEVTFSGVFNTINSKAQNVTMKVTDGSTIESLALDAIAKVLGKGDIKRVEVNTNADGSVFDQTLKNVVLNNGTSIVANGETISESISSNETALLKEAILAPDSISIRTDTYVANLNEDDFKVEATIDGQPVTLRNLEYREDMKRLFFTPVVNDENVGKELKVKVIPQGKLSGDTITTNSIELESGFSGRITNVQSTGMPHVTIDFKDELTDEYATTTTTDEYGYYYVYAPQGSYSGTISGSNVVTTQMYAYTSKNTFTVEQNETAIATAATSEMKIVVDWGKLPFDVDSHLVGLNDGKPFHVFYQDRVEYNDERQSLYDLDWDDTQSYGPETTTFRKLNDGQYIFYLHNYSGNYNYEEDYWYENETPTSTLANSEASIKIYKGNSTTPTDVINIADLKSGSEDHYFYAYGIEISNNGQNIEIVPIKKFDKYVHYEDIADLKSYLNMLKEKAEEYVNESSDDSEAYKNVKLAFEKSATLNANTAAYRDLLLTTLDLKIALTQANVLYDYDEYYDYDYENDDEFEESGINW